MPSSARKLTEGTVKKLILSAGFRGDVGIAPTEISFYSGNAEESALPGLFFSASESFSQEGIL